MKPIVLITLLGLASLGLGCNTSKTSTDPGMAADSGTTTISSPAPTDPSACRLLRAGEPGTSNPISSLEGQLDGSCVVLTVRYAGGCEAHDFQLHWNGTIQESYPAQAQLVLVHSGKRDGCQRMITEELRFDLGQVFGLQAPPLKISIIAEGSPGLSVALEAK